MLNLAKSVFPAYVIWAVIILSHTVWVYYFREYHGDLSEEMVSWIQFHGLVMAFVFLTVGAVLAWRTQVGGRWARWLFIAFCLSYALDSLFGSFAIGPIHENFPPYSIFRGPIAFIVWCYLLALAWFMRSNKSLNKDAHKVGAC